MSEETRTTSSTGGQKGVKAQRYDLLPKPGLDAISEVYAFGAEKYADHNWRKGYEWGKSYAALMRHMTAFWNGETNDPESGLPHVAHAGFHVLTLLTWLAEQGEGGQFDDRYVPAPVEDPVQSLPDGWRSLGWMGEDGLQIEFEEREVPLAYVLHFFGMDDEVISRHFGVAPQPVRFVVGGITEDLQGYHNRG